MNETSEQFPEAALRPIARDTSDFAKLRRSGAIYVDKTAYFHRLISGSGLDCVFLSRPRRFGKSLMISTFEEIFKGRRDLFDGLAIAKTDWQWRKYLVIKFRFNGVSTLTLERFDADFAAEVSRSLAAAGVAYDSSLSPGQNFSLAIEKLGADAKDGFTNVASNDGKGRGVVILIDEYDAPVAHALADIDKAEAIRERLSEFYIQMKDRTGYIRFAIITGVSKFSKLSVFSALSNIVDISMEDPAYAAILGYTDEELTANFEPHLREHARRMGMAYEDYRAEMKRWYNGFRFSKFDDTTLYNPVSVSETLALKNPVFTPKWTTTGRPSMLMNYLKREDVLAKDYAGEIAASESDFDVADLRNLRPTGMLFQAGYLTIKGYNAATGRFRLGVPDEEVRRDMNTLLTGVAAGKDMVWAAGLGTNLLECEWPQFFHGLASLFAGMAYGSTESSVHENSFARCLAFLLASCGFDFTMENVQSDGRADIVAKHPAGIWIFELKVDTPVEEAMRQIHEKDYATPYLASGKAVWAIGLSFDRKTRRLVGHAVEKLA